MENSSFGQISCCEMHVMILIAVPLFFFKGFFGTSGIYLQYSDRTRRGENMQRRSQGQKLNPGQLGRGLMASVYGVNTVPLHHTLPQSLSFLFGVNKMMEDGVPSNCKRMAAHTFTASLAPGSSFLVSLSTIQGL
ncbi:hypothetical protein CRENBAI_018519 [Crenichthys baileyi]|uniref:Uncharacterized protein n=1 Tax=Crenichthys baileyi TaxID=28760 RepID=A0AAV9RZS0_9TELE